MGGTDPLPGRSPAGASSTQAGGSPGLPPATQMPLMDARPRND